MPHPVVLPLVEHAADWMHNNSTIQELRKEGVVIVILPYRMLVLADMSSLLDDSNSRDIDTNSMNDRQRSSRGSSSSGNTILRAQRQPLHPILKTSIPLLLLTLLDGLDCHRVHQ